MNKTEYRLISDGHVNFLQYKYIKSYLFGLIKKEKWSYVWRPYYDKFWGRELDFSGYDKYVNDYTDSLYIFVERWKDINDYFEYAEEQQNELEQIAKEFHINLEKEKGKITKI